MALAVSVGAGRAEATGRGAAANVLARRSGVVDQVAHAPQIFLVGRIASQQIEDEQLRRPVEETRQQMRNRALPGSNAIHNRHVDMRTS